MKKIVVLSIVGALYPLVPSHAVVLEQKWQAGQQLAYQTTLQGTANMQAPANAPFLWAGVPLEVEIQGKGLTQLQTLDVNPAGTGTVVVSVPQFDLQAQALGQSGRMTLQNDKSSFTLNGKALKFGDGKNPLAAPTVALQISKQGKFVGYKDLAPKPVTAPAAPQADAKPVDPSQAINKGALAAATVIRALPSLWPGRDIQDGETWQATLAFPNGQDTTPQQVGTWDMTLKGTETVDGQTLQRVGVKGTLAIDSMQFGQKVAAPAPNAKPAAAMGQGKVKQDVDGDLWFDAARGQIVRADLTMGARAEGGKTAKDSTWADFTGSLQLKLQNG